MFSKTTYQVGAFLPPSLFPLSSHFHFFFFLTRLFTTGKAPLQNKDEHKVVLDLSDHALHSAPRQILMLPFLHTLNLSHNFLSTLVIDLSPLKSLRSLHLSGNLMTSLPLHLANALPNFLHLNELNLAHNKLWYLEPFPESVAKTLTHLDISNNSFIQIPTHLSNLTALQILDISNNQFCDNQCTQNLPRQFNYL